MTHKDAPPRSIEEERFETFWTAKLVESGQTCGFSRDRHGNYHASFARDAWAAWEEAKRARIDTSVSTG